MGNTESIGRQHGQTSAISPSNTTRTALRKLKKGREIEKEACDWYYEYVEWRDWLIRASRSGSE